MILPKKFRDEDGQSPTMTELKRDYVSVFHAVERAALPPCWQRLQAALGWTASPTTTTTIKGKTGFMEGDQQQQQDEWARSRHARLPTFVEDHSRKTRPPVDLFMF